VYASDISQKQLDQAPVKKNIEYILCAAEETSFPENTFDLITVSQAYHWLNGQKFQREATRVGKKDCVVAVWMYDLIQSEEKNLDNLIRDFYKKWTGDYWDAERKHVDTHYANVVFDFAPLPGKEFLVQTHLTREQLVGYFSTSSATQNFIKANGYSPLEHIKDDLIHLWPGEDSRPFYFSIVLKLGKVNK
jgi:ubiquinone/menaquinone biosynthesis C-methylase UbiE